ncbi:MAG: glycosyltransferase [Deltaproteobacteria bacterium]|nr:glycosyltransferase [Deltaproteobacteria bacterium]
MRAALFGTYNRSHSANRIVAAAVRAAGYEVVEIHEPLWERTRDKGDAYFRPAALIGHGLTWLRAAWRLAAVWRASGGAAVAVVGFNGQLDVLLLRLLTLRYGPRIVFAPLVSVTETLIEDRRVYGPGSVAARALRLLDWLCCRAADVTVVDTDEHRRYFIEELGVDPSRLMTCYLGADAAAFELGVGPPGPGAAVSAPAAAPAVDPPAGVAGASMSPLEVLYFGQYLPLHGLDVIVDAVGRLAWREDLVFTFIGTGPLRARIEAALRATRAKVRFVDWVPYETLAEVIARADIVLGIFGSSRKARMVIPNKLFEAALVGRAIVSADTPAVRELFEADRDLLLCQPEGRAVAEAIARLAGDAQLRRRLGTSARDLMRERFSQAALGRAWREALAGPEARRAAAARVGVAVLAFNDAARTLACLHSLAGDPYPDRTVLVVDNGSVAAQRKALEEGMRGRIDAEVVTLPENLGYAGGNNEAMRRLFGTGCDYVLILNSDTLVGRGATAALVEAALGWRGAAPIGPRVCKGRPGAATASAGERYWRRVLWAPRSLMRVRRRRQRPYPVGGVVGCALLVSRSLFERLGGFDENLFAYYEEVELCLRARDAGFVPLVAPLAEVGHAADRGFVSGMTPLAAYLKARNLWLVGAGRLGASGPAIFVAGYAALIAASAALYAIRGRTQVVQALLRGAREGRAGISGPPPPELFAASGYPTAPCGGGDAQEAAP